MKYDQFWDNISIFINFLKYKQKTFYVSVAIKLVLLFFLILSFSWFNIGDEPHVFEI